MTAHSPGTARLLVSNTSLTSPNITVSEKELSVLEPFDPLPLRYQLTLTQDPSSRSLGTLTVALLRDLFVGEQVTVTASLLPSDGRRVVLDPSGLTLDTAQPSIVSSADTYITGNSTGSAWVNVSAHCSGSLRASFKVNVTDPPGPAFERQQASVSVFENASIGDFVFAANISNASLVHLVRYTLTGGAQTFSVDSKTGVVRVNGILNYESVSFYTISITATDYRGRNSLMQVRRCVRTHEDT